MTSAAKIVVVVVLVAGFVIGKQFFAQVRRDAVSSAPMPSAVAQQTQSITESKLSSVAFPAQEPLPPAGKRFAEIERVLSDRARAGDVEAAKRLFHDADLCYEARSAEDALKRRAERGDLDSSVEALAAEPVSSLQVEDKELARLHSALTAARRSGDLCKGTDQQILDGRMYWYARQAAKAGDARAASCFLSGGFMPPAFDSDEPLREDFRKDMLPMADEQLRLGNVGVATVLAIYHDDSVGIMSYVRPASDLAKSYIYRKLNSFISSDETASATQDQLQQVSATLTPEQIAVGDAEATRLFDADFRRRARIPASDEHCH